MDKINRLLFASTNFGKLAEVREEAKRYSIEVLSVHEVSELKKLELPTDVEETAPNYEGNARLKADMLFDWSDGFPTLADDSGLEVEALGGIPGVNTARFAGPNAKSTDNITKLLQELDNSKNRKAKFVCSLCLKISDKQVFTVRAELHGEIGVSPYGKGGFGYDPIFIPEGHSETLSELKENNIEIATHRISALRKLFNKLN